MRWSCREALPWTTKINAILTGLAGMYSTESSSHCTLLLAFPVWKQNTGHLWVYPQGRGTESSARFTSAPSSKAASKGKWEVMRSASLRAIMIAPLSSVTIQGQHPMGSSHPSLPHAALPAYLNPHKSGWTRISTQMFMSQTKLYLAMHICIFKWITSKFLSTVQSIQKMRRPTSPLLPQKWNPLFIKRCSLPWSAQLCWEAGETLLLNSCWGLSQLIVFIWNSRCIQDHLNGNLHIFTSSGRRRALTILFKIYVHFYFNGGIPGLHFLKQTPRCKVKTGCTD